MIKRNAQASMEFIMTYGWAILVVLAAVGALAYFGVLSPDRFLPETCTFPAGLDCVDKATISSLTNSVQLALRNNVGYKINITSVTGTEDCTVTDFSSSVGTSVDNNELFVLTVNCADFDSGRFKSDITVIYVTPETGLTHPVTGSIVGRASEEI